MTVTTKKAQKPRRAPAMESIDRDNIHYLAKKIMLAHNDPPSMAYDKAGQWLIHEAAMDAMLETGEPPAGNTTLFKWWEMYKGVL